MKIIEILHPKGICVDLQSISKEKVIEELVELLIDAEALDKKHKNKVVEILLARESLGSTAIGQGIAIPHGKTECIKKIVGCLGVSKKGINFDSLDGEPAHIFFMLLAPLDSAGPHLKALAKISRLLKDKYFRDSLKNIKDEKTIIKLIAQEEQIVKIV